MEPITRKEVFLNAMCADKPCDLDPVSREEILLKRLVEAEAGEGGGSGLPAGAKPNQYVVTDGEGKAGWEDKLCWSETAVKEWLAETSFTFETDDGYTEFEMPALTIGKKYTVKLNGVGYDLECFDDNGTPTIGAPYGDWSSYPFAICTYEDVAILAVQKAGTYTVSVSCEGETIHKLSGKYVEGMGWSETHLQPLVKNLAYTTEEFDDDCSIYRDNGNNVTFEPNTQYRVEYDGEIYTCITRPIYDYYEPGTQDVLGNAGLSQHHVDGGAVDSGEPFCIQPHSGGWWVGTRTPGKHTFSIWKETETIHPIDKKYVMGSNLRVVITVDENDEYVASNTYEEIKNHVLSGGTCDCVMGPYIMCLTEATFMHGVQPFGAAAKAIFMSIGNGYEVNSVAIEEDGAVYVRQIQLSFEDV